RARRTQRRWRGALRDGFGELTGRLLAERAPGGGEVGAEQAIEERVLGGVEGLAEPPEPVGALGGGEVAPRLVERGGRCGPRDGAALMPREQAARAPEQVPGAVLHRIADPDVEVGVDPRAGVQGGE